MNKPEKLDSESKILELWEHLADIGHYDGARATRTTLVEVSPCCLVDIFHGTMRLDNDHVFRHGPYSIKFIVNSKVGTYRVIEEGE